MTKALSNAYPRIAIGLSALEVSPWHNRIDMYGGVGGRISDRPPIPIPSSGSHRINGFKRADKGVGCVGRRKGYRPPKPDDIVAGACPTKAGADTCN